MVDDGAFRRLSAGEAARIGGAKSGIDARARGWNVGVCRIDWWSGPLPLQKKVNR